MKKLLLLFLSFGMITANAQTTHTVGTSGFTFTPDTLVIDEGDHVDFVLGSTIHNAVEVSQSTWMSNGTTSNGGFVVPFGGGMITISTAGTYYYVCQTHAASGMKGVIIANPANGIEDKTAAAEVKAWPTQVTELLTVQVESSQPAPLQIFIYNIVGELVYSQPLSTTISGTNLYTINFTEFISGPYFVKVVTGNEIKTIRVMK